MSAHDLALGLTAAVVAAACVQLGMWLQRAFRDDELDHVTAALARCGRVADQADRVAAGLDGGADDDEALALLLRKCGYLLRCAIAGVPECLPDADERTTP